MNIRTIAFALLLFFFSVWGYVVGMLDYRLMINTAASCHCWVKYALLMGFATLFVAWAVVYFIIKRSERLFLKDETKKRI